MVVMGGQDYLLSQADTLEKYEHNFPPPPNSYFEENFGKIFYKLGLSWAKLSSSWD